MDAQAIRAARDAMRDKADELHLRAGDVPVSRLIWKPEWDALVTACVQAYLKAHAKAA